jgi:hypothetical protein
MPTAGKSTCKNRVLFRGRHARAIASVWRKANETILSGVVIAAGLTLPAFGQGVDPEEGIYQLNLAKSTIRGPAPKTQTLNIEKRAFTAIGFDINGKPYTIVYPTQANNPEDATLPITGSRLYDAAKGTRIDPYTVSFNRTKDGKVVETGVRIYNPKDKTLTVTYIGTSNSVIGPYSHIFVYEKQ